jgi:23S rRNA (adenine-N6)-dimethyltransferase
VPGHRRRSDTSWGWHSLSDTWATRIVSLAGVQHGDLVLDIGAGEGAITAALTAAGAHVIAFELHPGRCRVLRARFQGERVAVVRTDVARLWLPKRPFRVVASPPYAVSSALLRRLLARGSRLESADLVLQRALVRRFVDRRAPGANRWGLDFALTAGVAIPRSAFRPPPRVDSRVLSIRRR